MKIYLRNQESFSPKAVDEYNKFATIVPEEEADLIVVNDFTPIETKKPVAINATCPDSVKSPHIIDLKGEDLSSVTAVAEWTLSNMIRLMRMQSPGEQMSYKTLGLIGFGRIAKQFAAMSKPHGMHIHAYDISEYYNMLEAVLSSDVVSLHITASEENKNFMDRQKFEQMKDGSYFLNSSRPWLVDMEALKWALDNKLEGAWFDFELPFKHPKLLTTNHRGGDTREAKEHTELLIANKVKKYVSN